MTTLLRRLALRAHTLPVRRRDSRRPRLYALLSFRDEMRFLPGWFAANAGQVDGVLAYDDGSTDGSAEFVAAQPGVLELIRRPPDDPPVWNEPEIHRTLLAAAGRHHADWLVAVDADERLEAHFGERARRSIPILERRGIRAAAVRLLDLWDSPTTARVDGVWGRAYRARLFAWRPDAVIDEQPLHGQWAPVNSRVLGTYPTVDLVIYHLRMIRASDRVDRRRRHEASDPRSEHQSLGYAHLTDPAGLELAALDPGREYAPLHRDPELAVIVLAVGNPPGLREAVESVRAQQPPPEIVVVNSGGGAASAAVAPLGVAVTQHEELLYPGAARNRGVAATRAPFVAFLAADCRAEPGWVAARLDAHHRGERAVACAVTNGSSDSTAAWASYALVFGNRMPRLPADRAARYGASYARDLLDEVGGFREDLRTGEDTELHHRLAADGLPGWDPRVRTAHPHPRTVRQMAADQYARGRRAGEANRQLWGTPGVVVAARSLIRVPRRAYLSVRFGERGSRLRLLTATPAMLLGAATFALGAMRPPA